MTFNQVVRGSNPRCLIEKDVSQPRDVFLMLDMGGLEPRTTQLVGAHEVRWTEILAQFLYGDGMYKTYRLQT